MAPGGPAEEAEDASGSVPGTRHRRGPETGTHPLERFPEGVLGSRP